MNINNKSESQNESIMNTPRQALIHAAVEGWKGDGQCSWISPTTATDICAWAESHLVGSAQNQGLLQAFEELVLEGLFFEIHHGLFDPSCYYCSFNSVFLEEIPNGSQYVDFWNDLVLRYDEEHGLSTWRHLGLCAGQGSQGPSDAPWGPCLGTSCCWFGDGSERCNHGLKFSMNQIVVCDGCGKEVIRENLEKFTSGLMSSDGYVFCHPKVCGNCTNSRSALIRLCKKWMGMADEKRSLEEFERSQK